MGALRTANLALAFALELIMLAAYAVSASIIFEGWIGWTIAVASVVAAVTIWGIWAAPRSERRLRGNALLALKGAMFGVAALTLAISGLGVPAAGLIVLAALNLGLARVFRQE